MQKIDFFIYGEPASKANSRRVVLVKGKTRVIKSQKALNYALMFAQQCKVIDPLVEDDIEVEIDIWYASRRPDLDESLILDLMQARIIKNDRQVKRKIITWHLDRKNPRARIRVRKLSSSIEPS